MTKLNSYVVIQNDKIISEFVDDIYGVKRRRVLYVEKYGPDLKIMTHERMGNINEKRENQGKEIYT